MNKNMVISSSILLSLITLISAQFYGYGRFSFSDFLYNIDPTVMTLAILFIVFFAFLYFSLSKIFKDKYGEPNKAIATAVALALSTLIIYWINRSGFDPESLLYDIGISGDALYVIAPLVILAGLIFLFTRFKERKFGKTLLVFGGLFVALSFTDLIYEKGAAVVIGIILGIIGLWLTLRKKGIQRSEYIPRYRPERPRRITFSGPRQEWVTKEKARPKLEEELAAIRRRQSLADERKRLRKGRREEKKDEEERIRAEKERRRKEREAQRLEELQQRGAERQQRRQREEELRRQREEERKQQLQQMGEERGRQMKSQKMVRHLEMLAAQKERELQKQEMMAAKGVRGAEQRVRTLRAELGEISRRMQRYQG